MTFKDTLDYIFSLNERGEHKKAKDLINNLEVEVQNTNIKLKNAELELLDRRETLACGSTPEECLKNFSEARGWLEQGTPGLPEDNEPAFEMGEELEKGDSELTWGYSFKAGGVSHKGKGIEVPGGYVLQWWK
jgi:hypothetical protein